MLLSSRFVLLAFISSILFVEAKVASPPPGLQRRKHHHHKKHHDKTVQSPQAGSTLSGTGTTPPPDGTLPSSIGNTLPASKPSGNTIPIPPYPKTLPIPSRQGGIKVKDICFGFSKKSIDDGLAKLNDLRQDFTNQVDKIPRPLVMWNNDLAYEAYKVASTCKWEHGNTPFLGQNLNSAGPERSLVDAVNIWWTEKDDFIKKGSTCDECGHVGAALWAQVTAMGCGIADCRGTGAGYPFVTACNFNQYPVNATYPPQAAPSTCPQASTVVPYHLKWD